MRRAAIIFILSLSLLLNNNARESYGFKRIFESFSKYNVKCQSCNICGRVNMKGGCDTKENFENIAYDLLRSMNISEKDVSIVYDESAGKASMVSQYLNGKIDLTAENNIDKSRKDEECILILDITQYGSIENIYDIGKRVKNFLEQFDSEPYMNFCITGYIPGKVLDSKREKIIEGFMEGLGAKKIDSINSEGLISVCGYSDILADPVRYGSSLMDVNIGCRYDSFDDMTYFIVGTPIINVEY